jgi:hypothetical protein
MGKYIKINPEIYLEVHIARMYMKKHSLSSSEFKELDKKHKILKFLKDGYEPFHLTGDDGIMMELENYINKIT